MDFFGGFVSGHRISTAAAVVFVLTVLLTTVQAQNADVVEGSATTLKCRFDPNLRSGNPAYYWIRTNKNEKDNVAIEGRSFDHNYEIDFKPDEGKYDLRIKQTSYDRDNGKFECKLKEGGTGNELHSNVVSLTVLIQPKEPKVTPSDPVLVEGTKVEITCSSTGGSPSPDISWYRKGSSYPLDAVYKKGETKDVATSSTLNLTPTKEDDGAEFVCEVSNRALPEGKKLQVSTKITVNYFPRITVGPYNPLLIEKGSSATVTCEVDSRPPPNFVHWTRGGHIVSSEKVLVVKPTSLEDGGSYSCEADNGLSGPSGTKSVELVVDVQYGPIVQIETKKEADQNEAVAIQCNVSSNPPASSIEWYKEGDEYFKQTGDTLRFDSVKAEDTGRYICLATNLVTVSGSSRGHEVRGNATTTLLVKHRPGKASITPAEPIASDGEPFSMTCNAEPQGWPEPTYKWWKEGSNVTVSISQRYIITTASVTNEGVYHCKPSNALGDGTIASVNLRVFEPPKFTAPLQSEVIKKTDDRDFSISCGARGTPRLNVEWLKNDEAISNDEEHEIDTRHGADGNQEVVESTLKFIKPLTANNRGAYICRIKNDVKHVDSLMNLKIEHAPIVVSQQDKVAFDLGETAYLECKMQAYPRPEFQWSYQDTSIPDRGNKYEMNVSVLLNDVYMALLKIHDVQREDLGAYTCKAANELDGVSTTFSLQQKGPPEQPTDLEVVDVGFDYITLHWKPGFNGGYINTTFYVHSNSSMSTPERSWDCQTNNPCNLTGLQPHSTFVVQVQAHNSKGKSDLSEAKEFTTKANIEDIPSAFKVEFNKGTGMVNVEVRNSVISMSGLVDMKIDGQWMRYQERIRLIGGRGSLKLESVPDRIENVRVSLCVEDSEDKCGTPQEAAAPVAVASLSDVEIVGIAVGCTVFALLVIAAVIVLCYCNKKDTKEKQLKKDYEMESSNARPKVITPNYRDGIVNKGVEHGMDSDDTTKDLPPVGYPMHLGVDSQMMNGHHMGMGVPGYGYLDRDTTPCNNGGSIDSQDSLWMKGNGDLSSDRTYPAYDPPSQVSNSYMYHDDYHHMHEDMMNQRNREHLVNGDSYAAVNKLKKRGMDPMDSPYHDVSGLPDPYVDDDEKPPHVSLSFDESLESGYSTPNSRSRRVIREIIV